MTAKILVLGAGGMLGHALCQTLSSDFAVYGALRATPPIAILPADRLIGGFDALSDQSLLSVISRVQPDVVINCVGLIKRPPAIDDSALAISLNALLPHRIQKLTDTLGARLIHISTDCVFNGTRGGYSEDDTADATDLYGRTKLLGEVQGDALTIRTSMIGPQLSDHMSLFDWYVHNQNESVPGYARAYFSGLTTTELSLTIAKIIADFPELKGLYHVSGERIDKYALLKLVQREYQVSVDLVRDEEFCIDRSLDDKKFRTATGIARKSWAVMLSEMRSILCKSLAMAGSSK